MLAGWARRGAWRLRARRPPRHISGRDARGAESVLSAGGRSAYIVRVRFGRDSQRDRRSDRGLVSGPRAGARLDTLSTATSKRRTLFINLRTR